LPPEQPNEHLEVLRPYRERARIHIENFPDILRSLTAVSPKNLKECSSARLRKMGGEFGAFYSRLAEVVRMPQPVRRTRPIRDIRQPNDPNFVTGEGLGFSSPLGTEASRQFQSSPFSPSESDPVEQSDHELRKKHETVTASMATEFISTILDICCDQPNPNSRIEFNPAPTTYTLDTPSFKTTCQDDGCLIRRHTSQLTGSWLPHGYNLAIVECKAQYTSWNEDEDIAQVSSNVLAQQVCEMISSVFERIETVYDAEDLSQKQRQ
jgi:hypothetical protein